MKLERMLSGAFAVGVLALACGCSSTTASRTPASSATIPNTIGTTNLMSAELLGPAPKVGKAHLVVDGDDVDVGATADLQSEESAPKDARRSDGSHRGGGFGSSK